MFRGWGFRFRVCGSDHPPPSPHLGAPAGREWHRDDWGSAGRTSPDFGHTNDEGFFLGNLRLKVALQYGRACPRDLTLLLHLALRNVLLACSSMLPTLQFSVQPARPKKACKPEPSSRNPTPATHSLIPDSGAKTHRQTVEMFPTPN